MSYDVNLNVDTVWRLTQFTDKQRVTDEIIIETFVTQNFIGVPS